MLLKKDIQEFREIAEAIREKENLNIRPFDDVTDEQIFQALEVISTYQKERL